MDFEVARAGLINHLATEIKDKRVLSAMSRVPRELFVPTHLAHMAYDDGPLPIGLNQTISQPYIVALMTEKLELTGNEKVLELGTGSGYQTAILAELAHHVVTTERFSELLDRARAILQYLGYKNIEMHLAEETLGWKSAAPYDAIISTAGAPRVPDSLIAQLAIEGRMVIPVGSRFEQDLHIIIKHKQGNEVINLGGCRFVSLIGKDAWEKEYDN
jgi:protein-L-isoaspartate(D-aspartate) O-methyltransferase